MTDNPELKAKIKSMLEDDATTVSDDLVEDVINEVAQASVEKSKRHRVNVSTSVKGIKTFDCTVDMQGFTMEEVLAESDNLVAELDLRYPKPEEVK